VEITRITELLGLLNEVETLELESRVLACFAATTPFFVNSPAPGSLLNPFVAHALLRNVT
jgi:hypothetical protein